MLQLLALSMVLNWVQVQSDTFVVKSSVGIERAKRVLRELEAFHQLIGTTVVFHKVELPELPIEVLLIGDDAQFADLYPQYNGKKMPVAGYYQRGQDRDYIVLSAGANGNLAHVVYHELTHYFLSRSLESRPTWLNEGLAEYFANAQIDDENVFLGGVSADRMQLLRADRLLPLGDFFAVDDRSPYYNESFKANVFYAQAWAFVHFMMHGPHKDEFRHYIEALGHGEAAFGDYVKTDFRILENELTQYLRASIRFVTRDRLKVSSDAWTIRTPAITAADAELAIAEIFISGGKLADARLHLERVAGMDEEFPRASYYRGVMARLTGEGDPRDYFIDALLDSNLGPRAAVHLVQLRELEIPAARRALEQAAASGTHMADVYWALSEIYLKQAEKIMETIRLSMKAASSPVPVSRAEVRGSSEEPVLTAYADVKDSHFRYRLLSESGTGPNVAIISPPFYPAELLADRVAGSVVMDVQVSEKGEVVGVWLISAIPEIFSGLATGVIQEWKFGPVSQKIRVVFDFIP